MCVRFSREGNLMRQARIHSRARAVAVQSAMASLASATIELQAASRRFHTCVERLVTSESIALDSAGRHCKLVICEPCQAARCSAEHEQLLRRIRAAHEAKPVVRIGSVSLTSRAGTFLDAEVLVDRMIRSWTEFSARKSFQSQICGYARTLRLEVDVTTNVIVCHTSVIALYDRKGDLTTAQAWQDAWTRLPGCDFDLASYYWAHTPVPNVDWHAMDREVRRITRIGLDPGELCEFVDIEPICDPTKLHHVLRALKGRKLIRAGRRLAGSAS